MQVWPTVSQSAYATHLGPPVGSQAAPTAASAMDTTPTTHARNAAKHASLRSRRVGIPFVLAGLYITAGRFFLDAYARRNMAYAITDRRVLIIRAKPFAKTVALNLASLPDVGLSEERGVRGTIQFGAPSLLVGRGWGSWTPAFDSTPRFIGVENGQAVFMQLQSLLPQRR